MKKIRIVVVIFMMISSLIAAESRLDKIKLNNELRVCIWPQYYGISFIDSRTQKLVGIDSDLAVESYNFV